MLSCAAMQDQSVLAMSRMRQIAAVCSPKRMALVARAEITRPSFWLACLGTLYLNHARMLSREISRLTQAESQMGTDLFDLQRRGQFSTRERTEKRQQLDIIPANRDDYINRKKKIKNIGIGLWTFALLARYKGW